MGVLHAKGHGIIMAGESEAATFTSEAFGRISPKDMVKWRGAPFYRTSSTNKLAFLNNVVGVFEAEVDVEGNVIAKIWEWKKGVDSPYPFSRFRDASSENSAMFHLVWKIILDLDYIELSSSKL